VFKKIGKPGAEGADPPPPLASGMMIVLCTFPDMEKAREIGTAMVSEGLAACVNLLPGVESIYRWEGRVQQEQEVLAMFKLKSEGFAKLEAALNAKHPYEVPEVVGIHADSVSEKYMKWVGSANGSAIRYDSPNGH
jgi:periplasmic divalent cation tolerance protein